MYKPNVALRDGAIVMVNATGHDVSINAEVFAAIINPTRRVLWSFQLRGGEVIAVPYSEDEVLWLDKKPDPPS
jgi:hypothetical protein